MVRETVAAGGRTKAWSGLGAAMWVLGSNFGVWVCEEGVAAEFDGRG